MEEATAAIAGVRAKANWIRTTIAQYLEPELMYSPDPNWPEILNTFDVVARRLADLRTEAAPVLRYLAYQPRKPTANTNDLPVLLGTRTLQDADMASIDDAADSTASIVTPEGIHAFNARLQDVEQAYAAEVQRVLKGALGT